MSDDVAVAKVVMPEKGVFLVRCQCEPPPCGAEAIVSLDYGADIGTVVESGTYDPERHGPRPPGFLLLRGREPGDDAQLAENERLSIAMRNTFVKAAQADVPDLRVPYARLSFARTRRFRLFASSVRKPDVARRIAETRRRCEVSVDVGQMGPRDEVGMMGGIGPCGRPCCCATWQQRYPSRLADAAGLGDSPVAMNGACGRFKCCLAFERE